MCELILRFFKNDGGVTAIEYGLIAGIISIVIIGAVTTAGTVLNNTFMSLAAAL